MECFLLGSGGMMPMPDRLLTSLAVRLGGQTYLFDAGEGVQLGLKRTRIGIRGLDVIAMTHLHADHCLGIFGLLMLRAQMPDPAPLTILGPPGTKRFVNSVRDSLEFYINYAITFVEWEDNWEGPAYSDEHLRIFWHPVDHTRFCLGYRVEEHQRPGKFDKQQARSLNIPEGPLWGKLQRGETITLKDGSQFSPTDVLGPSRPGRKLAFVVDTRTCKGIYRCCQDVDLAFVEGMFMPEEKEHAQAKGHLTVDDAARISQRAGVKRTVLVHISPRYDGKDLRQLDAAAKKRFAQVEVGRDYASYTIEYDRTGESD